jgi:hypothetical protein
VPSLEATTAEKPQPTIYQVSFTVVDFSPVDDSNQLSSRSVDSQFALVFLFINESTENF